MEMDPPPREPERRLISLPGDYPSSGRDGSRRVQLLCWRRKKHEARGVQRSLGQSRRRETKSMIRLATLYFGDECRGRCRTREPLRPEQRDDGPPSGRVVAWSHI